MQSFIETFVSVFCALQFAERTRQNELKMRQYRDGWFYQRLHYRTTYNDTPLPSDIPRPAEHLLSSHTNQTDNFQSAWCFLCAQFLRCFIRLPFINSSNFFSLSFSLSLSICVCAVVFCAPFNSYKQNHLFELPISHYTFASSIQWRCATVASCLFACAAQIL